MSAAVKSACVEIGGIPIGLSCCDDGFLDLLRQRYRGFMTGALPEFELEFDLSGPAVVSDEIMVGREGGQWLIERGDLQARCDMGTGRGRVRQNANPYSLDAVLRILHSLILAERGGFLLHSASAICEGRAYLFSGVSGAGKTTMTRLAPPDVTLLTDEISYLRPSADGYSAYGTPFAGELAKAGENCQAPVGGLFFLEKGAENEIEAMASPEAVRRLMRNVLFFAHDPALVEKLFTTACHFIETVPIRRLTFYPDARVWEEVRNFGREFASNSARTFDEVPQHA